MVNNVPDTVSMPVRRAPRVDHPSLVAGREPTPEELHGTIGPARNRTLPPAHSPEARLADAAEGALLAAAGASSVPAMVATDAANVLENGPAMAALGLMAYGGSAARLGRTAAMRRSLARNPSYPAHALKRRTGYERGPFGMGVETHGDASFKPSTLFRTDRAEGRLADLAYMHRDVEVAYPGMGDVPVRIVPDAEWKPYLDTLKSDLPEWAYSSNGFTVHGGGGIVVRGLRPGEGLGAYLERADRTLVHEMQHIAQEVDGIRAPYAHLTREDYVRDAREVDARNSSFRSLLGGDERQVVLRRATQDTPPEMVNLDDKGGDNHATFRNFLASDDVPETLFGIPVVQDESRYTESDLEFFRKNPKAAGFYEMGDEEMDGDVPQQAAGAEGTVPQLSEQQLRAIAGGPRRQWATAFEDKLDVRPVKQQNGSVAWLVYPKGRKGGTFDAAGYRGFKGKTDGTWHMHSDPSPMSLDQWIENADRFDADADGTVDAILLDFGLDKTKVTQATKDTLWDMAFISGLDDKKGIRGVLRNSRNLNTTFGRLVNSGRLTREEAFDLALLSELDTYHKGNHGRVMARVGRLAEAISDIGNPDRTPYRSAGEAFASAVANGTRGTAEEREYEGFKTRMKNVRAAVEDIASGGDGRVLWRDRGNP